MYSLLGGSGFSPAFAANNECLRKQKTMLVDSLDWLPDLRLRPYVLEK